MKELQTRNGEDSLEMEIRLWEYIDGSASPEEVKRIDTLLAEQAEWSQKYGELLELNGQLGAIDMEEPSLRFTKNVMEEIARHTIAPATKGYINKNIIRGIGLFFVTTICALVAYGFKGLFNPAQSGDAVKPSLLSIDYTAIFDSSYVSVFMMVNIVLALLLLDRYLRRKQLAREHDLYSPNQ